MEKAPAVDRFLSQVFIDRRWISRAKSLRKTVPCRYHLTVLKFSILHWWEDLTMTITLTKKLWAQERTWMETKHRSKCHSYAFSLSVTLLESFKFYLRVQLLNAKENVHLPMQVMANHHVNPNRSRRKSITSERISGDRVQKYLCEEWRVHMVQPLQKMRG